MTSLQADPQGTQLVKINVATLLVDRVLLNPKPSSLDKHQRSNTHAGLYMIGEFLDVDHFALDREHRSWTLAGLTVVVGAL
ncbi:hypothetical protein EYZ11_002422 [Aspergillus tanneri]|uniref:Uncharacterized protein n=1 Tax=Aspergillus tanneri TaxID=1220188 RepID=A0A4S3JRH6_9EURO|nr:hypothetical protein EYZ11_002422 [Aspergillus tanneri]